MRSTNKIKLGWKDTQSKLRTQCHTKCVQNVIFNVLTFQNNNQLFPFAKCSSNVSDVGNAIPMRLSGLTTSVYGSWLYADLEFLVEFIIMRRDLTFQNLTHPIMSSYNTALKNCFDKVHFALSKTLFLVFLHQHFTVFAVFNYQQIMDKLDSKLTSILHFGFSVGDMV